jgi:hypothetical protein
MSGRARHLAKLKQRLAGLDQTLVVHIADGRPPVEISVAELGPEARAAVARLRAVQRAGPTEPQASPASSRRSRRPKRPAPAVIDPE